MAAYLRRVIERAPDWFVVEFARLVYKETVLVISSTEGATEARRDLLEDFGQKSAELQQSLAETLQAKIVQGLGFQMDWRRIYPNASKEAAQLMMVMCSDARPVTEYDWWPHHGLERAEEELVKEVVRLQFWLKEDGDSDFPALVVSWTLGEDVAEIQKNQDRLELAEAMFALLNPTGFIKLSGFRERQVSFVNDRLDIMTRSQHMVMRSSDVDFGRGLYQV